MRPPVAAARITATSRNITCLTSLTLTLAGRTFVCGAQAAEPFPGLASGGAATVARVRSGDSLRLTGGDRLRLAGIQAPRMARRTRRGTGGQEGKQSGGRNSGGWPLAPAARDALAALVRGRRIAIYHGPRRVDRYGRLIAHVTAPGGVWVQGRLLARGFARVYTFPGNPALARRMLALEAAARNARRGIWAHPFYRVRRYREGREYALRRYLDSFQIVRGRVLRVARTRARTYLNFGQNWRRDFTVGLDRRAARRFRAAGLDPASLAGREVRVRGWLYWRNGPMIRATHPAQVEVLDIPATRPKGAPQGQPGEGHPGKAPPPKRP